MNLKAKDIKTINAWNQKIGENRGKIEFDVESHTYHYDGEEMISVSKRLEFIQGNIYSAVAGDVLAKAAERGTAVHQVTEWWDLEDPQGDRFKETAHEDIDPYLRAYESYIKDNEPNYLWVEQKIALPTWKTAGTIDRVALHFTKDGKMRLKVIDLKTGQHNYKNVMQIQLYALMLKSILGIKHIPSKELLYLKKDGTYKTYPIV